MSDLSSSRSPMKRICLRKFLSLLSIQSLNPSSDFCRWNLVGRPPWFRYVAKEYEA